MQAIDWRLLHHGHTLQLLPPRRRAPAARAGGLALALLACVAFWWLLFAFVVWP